MPVRRQRIERALADRASIAVLAFSNMSGDPSQEYFSDGITEDIITELSRFSELFVIARNSTFQYKGKAIDVRQVGRELGVRYVLEGSIRREGDRVRISAQLIDAVNGAHRWAERYDRKLEDMLHAPDRTCVHDRGRPCRPCEQGRGRTRAHEAAHGLAGLRLLHDGEGYALHPTNPCSAPTNSMRRDVSFKRLLRSIPTTRGPMPPLQ